MGRVVESDICWSETIPASQVKIQAKHFTEASRFQPGRSRLQPCILSRPSTSIQAAEDSGHAFCCGPAIAARQRPPRLGRVDGLIALIAWIESRKCAAAKQFMIIENHTLADLTNRELEASIASHPERSEGYRQLIASFFAMLRMTTRPDSNRHPRHKRPGRRGR